LSHQQLVIFALPPPTIQPIFGVPMITPVLIEFEILLVPRPSPKIPPALFPLINPELIQLLILVKSLFALFLPSIPPAILPTLIFPMLIHLVIVELLPERIPAIPPAILSA